MEIPDCGTERGYFNHIQRHETTCGACRAAHAEGERQRNRQRHLPPVERRTRVIAQRPARYPQGPVDEVLPCTPTAAHDESTNADEGDQADGA